MSSNRNLKPIEEITEALGLGRSDIELRGKYVAKVSPSNFPQKDGDGKLIVVTAITPTPAGEGKSTTAAGLVQGLARIGKNPCLTIRQPSLGPVFGHKGGGTGGGMATVEPGEDINLHFTGDFHAVQSAHNLLAAMTDNAVLRGSANGLAASGISWRRVTDAEDRGLRRIISGIGEDSLTGPLNETGYDISAASEIMATVALAKGYKDARERLSNIVVGWTKSKEAVTASDVKAVGSMMALLRDAMKPNVVQTREGQPAIVHMGPFGNIAHGCSSILADILAVGAADYVVTEAGFGADLGFEKFMDIKIRQGGPKPSAAVVVATVRGLKWHGGVPSVKELGAPNVEAVRKGAENLRHAVGIVRSFGLPAVVALNRFPFDTPEEIVAVREAAESAGAVGFAESKGFSEGGAGMTDLANLVVEACKTPADIKLLYEDSATLEDKVNAMAKTLYLAGKVQWSASARRSSRLFQENNWDFPVCMAKTHLSISANSRLRGAPSGHTLAIKGLRLLAGARQIVALAGDIITLPGLPSIPNAWDIDLNDETGEITGLL